jgi:hypothetical protein
VHVKENQALCGNAKQRLCVTFSQVFKEELRFSLPGGQSSDCPLARIATVLGKNYRSHLRSVAQHGTSRYVILIYSYGHSVFIDFPMMIGMSG